MTYCFNGTSIVSNLDKYGIIDTLGNILLPLRYDNITYITDELAAAREKGLYCLVDTKGHVLAECIRDGEMTADEMAAWAEDVSNRVGGKRSSFLPTFVFRPLTPPHVRFRIRRFFILRAI